MTPAAREERVWTASQRGVLLALLLGILAYLAVRLLLNPEFVSDPQPRVPPRAHELEDRIDPNTADWSTLAAMPMIGEKRARDIVAYREQFVADNPGRRAFERSHDLLRIRGIGLSMLSQIEKYLIFPEQISPATQSGAPGMPAS